MTNEGILKLSLFPGLEWILPQCLWARSSVQFLQSLHDRRWNVPGWWITRDESDQSSKTTSNVKFIGIIVEMTDGTGWNTVVLKNFKNSRPKNSWNESISRFFFGYFPFSE